MIPEHVVILIIVLIVAWDLFRWGALILIGYAFVHFCLGQWTAAMLALIYALFLEFVKRCVIALMRVWGPMAGAGLDLDNLAPLRTRIVVLAPSNFDDLARSASIDKSDAYADDEIRPRSRARRA